jgi:hypothetical protein
MTPQIRGRTVERARVARSMGSAPPPNVVVVRVRGAAERVDTRASTRPGGADAVLVSDADPYPSLAVAVRPSWTRRPVARRESRARRERTRGDRDGRRPRSGRVRHRRLQLREFCSESGVDSDSRTPGRDDHPEPIESTHAPYTVPVAVRIRSVVPRSRLPRTSADRCPPLEGEPVAGTGRSTASRPSVRGRLPVSSRPSFRPCPTTGAPAVPMAFPYGTYRSMPSPLRPSRRRETPGGRRERLGIARWASRDPGCEGARPLSSSSDRTTAVAVVRARIDAR